MQISMKGCFDLPDPSNAPLEFSVMRGCIGFQIIQLISAGIFFLKHNWTFAGGNAVPDALLCERLMAVYGSKQSVTFELK